jgi:hypothetical protein
MGFYVSSVSRWSRMQLVELIDVVSSLAFHAWCLCQRALVSTGLCSYSKSLS